MGIAIRNCIEKHRDILKNYRIDKGLYLNDGITETFVFSYEININNENTKKCIIIKIDWGQFVYFNANHEYSEMSKYLQLIPSMDFAEYDTRL
jgi:hypothetical protein